MRALLLDKSTVDSTCPDISVPCGHWCRVPSGRGRWLTRLLWEQDTPSSILGPRTIRPVKLKGMSARLKPGRFSVRSGGRVRTAHAVVAQRKCAAPPRQRPGFDSLLPLACTCFVSSVGRERRLVTPEAAGSNPVRGASQRWPRGLRRGPAKAEALCGPWVRPTRLIRSASVADPIPSATPRRGLRGKGAALIRRRQVVRLHSTGRTRHTLVAQRTQRQFTKLEMKVRFLPGVRRGRWRPAVGNWS